MIDNQCKRSFFLFTNKDYVLMYDVTPFFFTTPICLAKKHFTRRKNADLTYFCLILPTMIQTFYMWGMATISISAENKITLRTCLPFEKVLLNCLLAI